MENSMDFKYEVYNDKTKGIYIYAPCKMLIKVYWDNAIKCYYISNKDELDSFTDESNNIYNEFEKKVIDCFNENIKDSFIKKCNNVNSVSLHLYPDKNKELQLVWDCELSNNYEISQQNGTFENDDIKEILKEFQSKIDESSPLLYLENIIWNDGKYEEEPVNELRVTGIIN